MTADGKMFSVAMLDEYVGADPIELGRGIRSVRMALALNQIEFSTECRISTRTLYKIETGERTGDVTPLFKILAWLRGNDVEFSFGDGRMSMRFPTTLFGRW